MRIPDSWSETGIPQWFRQLWVALERMWGSLERWDRSGPPVKRGRDRWWGSPAPFYPPGYRLGGLLASERVSHGGRTQISTDFIRAYRAELDRVVRRGGVRAVSPQEFKCAAGDIYYEIRRRQRAQWYWP